MKWLLVKGDNKKILFQDFFLDASIIFLPPYTAPAAIRNVSPPSKGTLQGGGKHGGGGGGGWQNTSLTIPDSRIINPAIIDISHLFFIRIILFELSYGISHIHFQLIYQKV